MPTIARIAEGCRDYTRALRCLPAAIRLIVTVEQRVEAIEDVLTSDTYAVVPRQAHVRVDANLN